MEGEGPFHFLCRPGHVTVRTLTSKTNLEPKARLRERKLMSSPKGGKGLFLYLETPECSKEQQGRFAAVGNKWNARGRNTLGEDETDKQKKKLDDPSFLSREKEVTPHLSQKNFPHTEKTRMERI